MTRTSSTRNPVQVRAVQFSSSLVGRYGCGPVRRDGGRVRPAPDLANGRVRVTHVQKIRPAAGSALCFKSNVMHCSGVCTMHLYALCRRTGCRMNINRLVHIGIFYRRQRPIQTTRYSVQTTNATVSYWLPVDLLQLAAGTKTQSFGQETRRQAYRIWASAPELLHTHVIATAAPIVQVLLGILNSIQKISIISQNSGTRRLCIVHPVSSCNVQVNLLTATRQESADFFLTYTAGTESN